MPHTEAWAKKLVKNLSEDPEALLDRRSYRDVTFIRLLLEHCDQILFENPAIGLTWAEIVPRLIELLPPDQVMNEEGQCRQRELFVRAHATVGGAYRALGRFDQADGAYARAREITAGNGLRALELANFNHRLAVLRSGQKRPEEALALLDEAIEIYREADDVVSLAEALVKRGYVYAEAGRFSEAIPDFCETLGLLKPTARIRSRRARICHSAIHNLAAIATEARCGVDQLSYAITYLREAKRRHSKVRNGINQYKLAWVEARIQARLGSDRMAERRFLWARENLLAVGAVVEAALVDLDLTALYGRWGDWSRAASLAAETCGRFKELGVDAELIAACRLWADAVKGKMLDDGLMTETRQLLESRTREKNPIGGRQSPGQ